MMRKFKKWCTTHIFWIKLNPMNFLHLRNFMPSSLKRNIDAILFIFFKLIGHSELYTNQDVYSFNDGGITKIIGLNSVIVSGKSLSFLSFWISLITPIWLDLCLNSIIHWFNNEFVILIPSSLCIMHLLTTI